MDMQGRDRELAGDYNRRSEEIERERIEAIERSEPTDPDMTGVPVEPAETTTDPRVGAAVVGGALGAVAGAIVGGPAGALVGGAVGAAGGAVVAGSNDQAEETVYDIDRPDLSGDIRRVRDDELEGRL